MSTNFRKQISSAATVIELTLGAVILLACVVSGLGIIFTTDIPTLFSVPAYLQQRMSDICLIIIGVELIKMITSCSIDAVVDVLLLTIARQMIVEHTSLFENLLAVTAVAILFLIHRFLCDATPRGFSFKKPFSGSQPSPQNQAPAASGSEEFSHL